MSGIKELEKWLTKKVMNGEKGAVEIRDIIRAKGRADIIRHMGTTVPPGGVSPTATNFPSETAQRMMQDADDGLASAAKNMRQLNATDGQDLQEAWRKWHSLRDKPFKERP